MTEERRGAARFRAPDGVEASVSGVPVRIVELSAIGGRIEHDQRFPLTAPQLSLTWRGQTASMPIRVARSEIAGQRASRLVYSSGIELTTLEPAAKRLLSAILGSAEPAPPSSAPASATSAPSFDDSWIRQVNFLKRDLEEDLPFAQFRLTAGGWQKTYVASPEQPEDGFTVRRDERDFAELQRTFELADPDTRQMMRIALESTLRGRTGSG